MAGYKAPHIYDYKVYINGIYVRTRSVQVNEIQGSAPTASIKVDTDYRSQLLGQNDCCPVHIFVHDNFARQSPHDYILFFDGFITAVSRDAMVKTVDVTLVCAHSSKLLDLVDMNFTAINKDGSTTAYLQNEKNVIPYLSADSGPPSLLMKNFIGSDHIEYPYQILLNALNWLLVDVEMEAGFPTWKSVSEGKSYDSPLKAWYTEQGKNLKLNKRYSKVPYYDSKLGATATPFPVMNELFKSDFLKHILNSMAQESNMLGVKIGEYIQKFLSMVEFEFAIQSAPSVSPTTGNLNTLTVKPLMYGAIPPKCNIIFSSMIASAHFENDILSKPTRIKMLNEQNAHSIGGIEHVDKATLDILDKFLYIYYPMEPQKSNVTVKSTSDTGNAIQKNKPSQTTQYEYMLQEMLPEEKRRGMHALQIQDSMFASFRRAMDVTGKEEELNSLWQRIAHHYYTVYRFAQQRASVNMVFNPYISVGYPTVIVGSPSDGNVYLGLINSISHNLSPDGASTGIGLSFVRELSEELQDPMRNGIKEDIATQTDVLKVDEIYTELLGCGSLKYSRMKAPESTAAAGLASAASAPLSMSALIGAAEDAQKANASKLELPSSMSDQIAAMNSVIANVNPKFDFKTKGLKDAVDEYFLARKKLDGITGDIKETFKDGNLFQDGNIPAYLDREWLVYNGANEELQLAYDFNYRSICTMKHFMNGEFGIDKPTDKDLTVVDILHRLPLQLKGKIFDIRANDAIYQFILAKIKTVKDDVIFNI